jgi:hypothetical protein
VILPSVKEVISLWAPRRTGRTEYQGFITISSINSRFGGTHPDNVVHVQKLACVPQWQKNLDIIRIK